MKPGYAGSSSEGPQASTSKRLKLDPHQATVYGLPDYRTALERRVSEVQQKLEITPVLGIVGMGGIGKTTVAKALFNKISGQFEYACFVDNAKGLAVRELKDWVLNHFLRNGTRVKQNSLQWSDLEKKKSLIAMDDVDSESQVGILPSLDEFGSGSRVIFTTRDRGVLNTLPNCVIYEVDFLKPDEAKKLFCQHAFDQEGIPDDLAKMNHHLEENVKKVVEKCAGLPLTLEVMGCYLRDHETNVGVWKETLDKLGKAQSVDGLRNDRVWSSLRVSYDALSPEEQGMFLEAGTYFFERPVETALAAWSTAFGYSVSGWANLLRTSMVKEVDKTKRGMDIKYKEVWVHEHLRELANHLSKGAMISRCLRESNGAVDLLNASAVQAQTSMLRLWDDDDDPTLQLELLDKFEKLKYLELHGISPEGSSNTFSRRLCLLKCSRRCAQQRRLLPFTLEGMNNLTVLDLECWDMAEESLEALEKLGNLRILYLDGISGPSRLPDNFGHLHHLKRLELSDVRFTALPHSFGNLSALKHLVLFNMPELLTLPDSFGNLSSLATLYISDCNDLAALPESFGHLSSLRELRIGRCRSLRCQQPPELRQFGLHETLASLRILSLEQCRSLERLPASFEMLSLLEELELIGCTQLKTLPDSIGQFMSLKRLIIEKAVHLEALPDSFGHLPSLIYLRLKECFRLERLPASFGNLSALEKFELHRCYNLKRLSDNFGQLSALKELTIENGGRLEALSDDFGGLVSLTSLTLDFCSSLETLPESFGLLSALQELKLLCCTKLQRLPDNFGDLSALKRLIILRADHLEELPDSLGNLTSLEDLYIWAHRLQRFPVSIGQLQALKKMTVQAEMLRSLPEDLGNLGSLETLRIESCRHLEALPDSFGLLSRLQELKLVECTQLRRLPDNFGQLSALKTLSIRGTDHLEELPDSLGNLSSLEDLCICADRLQRFPVSIGQLQALKKMIVEAKMLRSVPEELGNLCSLEMLRIERCLHLEALPDSLGRISVLGVVILDDCRSLKSLPDSLGKNFGPHGDRSTETRRPVAGHSCQIASREGFLLHIWECPLLDDSVLQRLGWIQSGRKWYRRNCHCE